MTVYDLLTKPINKIVTGVMNFLCRQSFGKCGQKVYVGRKCTFSGIENIELGNQVFIGANNCFLCSRAKVIIKGCFMSGPNVTFITGDHRTDIKGRPMISIRDNEKLPENDVPIIIEEDVWVGANAMILKGVTVGKGAVIAAGSVVTEDVPPYSIVGGVPAKVIKSRFTPKELQKVENYREY